MESIYEAGTYAVDGAAVDNVAELKGIGLLRGFRTADLIDFLRCRGRLLVSVMHFVGPTIAEA